MHLNEHRESTVAVLRHDWEDKEKPAHTFTSHALTQVARLSDWDLEPFSLSQEPKCQWILPTSTVLIITPFFFEYQEEIFEATTSPFTDG